MSVTAEHKRVLRVERDDGLKPASRTAAGFLMVEGRIARTGIQVYQDAAGNTRRELRPADEVFHPDALASFRQVPVTNTHPPGLLTPQSVKHFAVGAVGEGVRKDEEGDFVAAPFVVYDADAIASIEAGRTQLSCGYSCELDETSGELNGEKYDAIQRCIRGNHLAVVDSARGGPQLTMRLDSAGNSVIPSLSGSTTNSETHSMAQQIRVDGLTIDLTDGNAVAIQQAIDKAVASEKVRADAAVLERDNAREIVSDLQAKLDAAANARAKRASDMKKCDECEGKGKVDGEKCDNCDGTGMTGSNDEDDLTDADDVKKKDAKAKRDQKRKDSIDRRIARAVRSRVALEVEARKHLGADAKLDGVPDLDVKRQVVAKLAPTAKLDDKDATYIGARFDAECEIARERPNTVDQVRAAASPFASAPRADAAPPTDPSVARANMLKMLHNAWKPTSKSAS